MKEPSKYLETPIILSRNKKNDSATYLYSRSNGSGRAAEKPNDAKERLVSGISHSIVLSVENAYSLHE